MHVKWDIKATFSNPAMAPNRYRICESLIHFDGVVLLRDRVRSIVGTLFVDAMGVYTQQVNSEHRF